MSKLPIFDFSQCRESQAKTQVIFQTKTVAKLFYWIGLQSREGCAEEGDEHGETCREKHDKTLDEIRTERDKELDDVRKEAEEDQKQVEAGAKEVLAITQAQIEQQLKNIREQGRLNIISFGLNCLLQKPMEIPFWFCHMSKLHIFKLFLCGGESQAKTQVVL